MARLLILSNIPSPYRLHLFEHLYDETTRRGLEFEVWFMAANEPERHWPYNPDLCHFPHRLLPGVHPRWGSQVFHINPIAWINALRDPPAWLLLGGSWALPTIIGLAFLSPFWRQRCTILFHSEANYHFSLHARGVIAFLRRMVLNAANAFVVPGKIAIETIRDFWQVKDPVFIALPNVVDESIYGIEVAKKRLRRHEFRVKYGIQPFERALLFPARLHESTKGNLNFLKVLIQAARPRLKVLLAGDGPDRSLIERWLVKHPEANAQLLRYQDTDRMIELLALSDGLVLPSYRDPNPLSIIEALWAALPIIT